MENQKKIQQRLPVRNKSGKQKIDVANIASIEKINGKTIVTDKNADLHTCRWSIKKIERKFPKCGLLILKRHIMVNLNHIEENEKISFDEVDVKGRKHTICYSLARKLKRQVKQYKLEFWKDYREIIKM